MKAKGRERQVVTKKVQGQKFDHRKETKQKIEITGGGQDGEASASIDDREERNGCEE